MSRIIRKLRDPFLNRAGQRVNPLRRKRREQARALGLTNKQLRRYEKRLRRLEREEARHD